MNIAIDFDKIKAMDSRITQVYLLRTQTYAIPAASAGAAIAAPNDIGDAGNGTMALIAGSVIVGNDGNKNSFTVVRILDQTSSTFTDSTLNRDYDYAYFVATSNESVVSHFLTMAPTLHGLYASPDRTVIIDSVAFIINYNNTVLLNFDTRTQVRLVMPGYDSKAIFHEQWGYTGAVNNNTIHVNGTLPSGQSITYPKADFSGQTFQALYYGAWYGWYTVKDAVTSYEITHPIKYLGDFTGHDATDFTTKGINRYYDTYTLAAIGYQFRSEWSTYWHYASGDFSNSGY